MTTANLKAGAVKRFLELHERAFRLEQAGRLPLASRRAFEEAMDLCRRGMLPQEIEMLESLAAKARADVMMRVNAVPFTLDTSKPPYQVQCPVCYANALAPCMSRPGVKIPASLFGKLSFPKDARVLQEPLPNVLDVYVPGSMPQVQLVHMATGLPYRYVLTSVNDLVVRTDVVERLVRLFEEKKSW